MLHEVKPHIININDDYEMLIDKVTNATIQNTGTIPFEYGFGDGGWRLVNEGQEVSLPAGANTIYQTGTLLMVRFVDPIVPTSTDHKKATLIYNEVTAIGRNV